MSAQLLAPGTLERALAAALVLAFGLLLGRLGAAALGRLVARRGTAQQALIARRTVFYGVLGITVAAVLRQLGLDLSVLLGAAGVLTVAIGFAAQTSASNLISGLFLLGERPFVVGDVIHVGASTGQVMSIDLLSVKLRTLDNLSVRVPNETLLKSEITNYTRYLIRRVDLALTVGPRDDLGRVHDLLLAIAAEEPLCLDEPRPQLTVRGFGPAGIDLLLAVWARRENVLEVANGLWRAMQETLPAEGIEIVHAQRLTMPAAAPAAP